ncbi:MAG: hypothetical protein ACM3KR_07185 [Deltaproteobacteria bacterium]
MVINARNNPNYGGNLINQKYSPLTDIVIPDDQGAAYKQLFTKRAQKLTETGCYPPNTTLKLYANWPADTNHDGIPDVNQDEIPMVVVSSNRANWMHTILDNANSRADFADYLDSHTFDDDIVPWYAPLRSGRTLYVVVHWSEYNYYHDRIGNFADVKVIGYKFTPNENSLDIVGFGASRFAALQAMIDLGYHKIWAVDDNVVNINGFPADLADIEGRMGDEIWGIGFRAATENIQRAALYDGTVTFHANDINFDAAEPGLLQQATLWNLNLLRDNYVNFSPIFVTSNEDVSLSSFLQKKDYDERLITALSIIKIEPENDPYNPEDMSGNNNLGGAVEVPQRRRRIYSMFNLIEEDLEINPGDGAVRLSGYIRNEREDVLLTQSRAVEQVLSASINKGSAYYPSEIFVHGNGEHYTQYLDAADI